jgi:hypothetical protein
MIHTTDCSPYLRRPAPSERLLAEAQFLAELYGIDPTMPWEPLRISVEHASGNGVRESYDALVHGANYPVRRPEHWPNSPLCPISHPPRGFNHDGDD